MTHVEAWELLCGRTDWLRRCLIIAHHYRDHPHRGGLALKAYALGRVTGDLEDEGHWQTAAALADSDIAWQRVFDIFLAISRAQEDG